MENDEVKTIPVPIDLLEAILAQMIQDFEQIDGEWGIAKLGGLNGAIARREVPEIIALRKLLGKDGT